MKTLKTWSVQFVFSLRIFCLCSHHSSITAPGMFTNCCLVCLLLFSNLPVPKFHFQLQKKKKLEKSPGKGWTWYNLAGGMTALANLYALYSGGARSFNQWHRALYPNLIININSLCSHHSSITAPGMFTNCCLVCLLLFSDLPVPKFHFQLQKKKKLEKSPGKGWTWCNLADGMTALANLYALYSGGAGSFNQWHRALYPNLIININRALLAKPVTTSTNIAEPDLKNYRH